MQGFGDEHMIT